MRMGVLHGDGFWGADIELQGLLGGGGKWVIVFGFSSIIFLWSPTLIFIVISRDLACGIFVRAGGERPIRHR